jgi:hypothetical protein
MPYALSAGVPYSTKAIFQTFRKIAESADLPQSREGPVILDKLLQTSKYPKILAFADYYFLILCITQFSTQYTDPECLILVSRIKSIEIVHIIGVNLNF